MKIYLEQWKRLLPDFEIKEWNESNFDVNFCTYSREAYKMKSFAHVSDVCRLFALYNEGGIYLDTDVELLKPITPFLADGSFIGTEDYYLGTAVIGVEPHTLWIRKFLEYYKSRHFLNEWGHLRRTPNTNILTRIVLPNLNRSLWPKIYPKNYFCGIDWDTCTPVIDAETVSVHHFAGSWGSTRTLKIRVLTILKGLRYRYIK